MNKLLIFLLIASCASHGPTSLAERKPASIFMDKYKIPGGKMKFKALILAYAADVQKRLESTDSSEAWFKMCSQKAKKEFTVREALVCHDQYASTYFMDINYSDIVATLDKSDVNSLTNNFYIYPAIVMKHYTQIAETLPE